MTSKTNTQEYYFQLQSNQSCQGILFNEEVVFTPLKSNRSIIYFGKQEGQVMNIGMIQPEIKLTFTSQDLCAHLKSKSDDHNSGQLTVKNGLRYFWEYIPSEKKLVYKSYLDEINIVEAQLENDIITLKKVGNIENNISSIILTSIFYLMIQ